MNKHGLILGLLVVATWAQAAEEKKTIYKYTDEKGVTHYSETKPNENYKEADLPQLSVVPSTPIKNTASSSSSTEAVDPSVVTEFEILSPSNEQNIWGSGNKLTATVTGLTEAQQEIYTIQFSIDGEKQKPSDQRTQTFQNIHRGEHTVQAFLLNKFTLKQVRKTNTVTFYMHQHSIK
ncbi:DUF4124 domain-containing protein [Marinicella litoralis]|uniref:Uncharacterized protein DUF4124 n=1 Tax=Marinicella litoralis TaxID=644220 RepID=A0A4V3DIX1_9GAMM|nr:DUF4124 domain-containing protein [Marinicella litoralis]TDR23891.1 uncharacterized protein DUF4124 [Marinicella litoralis]